MRAGCQIFTSKKARQKKGKGCKIVDIVTAKVFVSKYKLTLLQIHFKYLTTNIEIIFAIIGFLLVLPDRRVIPIF